MVATVGSISIDLSTNASKFATGFKSAATTVEQQSARMSKSIANFQGTLNVTGGLFKTFVGGLAAGAGLASITSLTGAFDKLKETISEYDKIASDAKTTGLKSDTFQALAFAAKQANIEYDSFNSSLDIFAKNSGLAEHGTGALYAGLVKLNPQLLQNILNTKDQEERLKLVADAMAQTTDATQKAALATVIFGKGGIEMTRILDGGRASIEKLKKAAQDLGVIIPDELLQKAGELDDKLDALSTVISAQLGQSLINLAPILIGAIQGFADFSKEVNSTAAVLDNFINNPSLANFVKLFGDGSIKNAFDDLSTTAHRSTEAIKADIESVQQTLANLKADAAAGLEVSIQTDRAQEDLKALQAELKRTQLEMAAAAVNAGEASSAFDNMLKGMDAIGAAASNPLPTVHRYGGDPNAITLPSQSSTYNPNANGSGVGVRSFGGDPNVKATADHTQETADNIDQLDGNTQRYFSDLSRDIGQYSAQQTQQQNIVINKLSDVTAEVFGALSQDILAALVAGSGPGSGMGGDSHMFGDAYSPETGSYVSSWGVRKFRMGTIGYDWENNKTPTSVQVAQPGSNITLNYTAAPGDSTATSQQRAREMWDELVRAQARG